MHIEVITQQPAGTARPTPLVFVHGAYGAAWIWEKHFLPYFAGRGYRANAISLRGHGESDGWETLAVARLRDYVADLEQVMDTLPTPPVLIGHSMGGMVVQHVLHRRPVPAAVLMASVPPHGILGTYFGMSFTNPGLFRELSVVQSFGPLAANGSNVRKALFSDDTPESVIAHVLPRLQAESQLVILDLMGLDLPPSESRLDLPVLVLGAGNDAFVYESAVAETAKTYRTTAELIPGMAHAMMLEAEWEKVASRIADWLDATLS